MLLYEPRLKKRTDGSMPAMNTLIGNIDDHFHGSHLTFHFGTNVNGMVCDYAWRVLVSDEPIDDSNVNDIHEAIVSLFGVDRIINDYMYLYNHGLQYQFIVFFDDDDWNLENNSIYVIDISIVDDKLCLQTNCYTQRDFQLWMRNTNGIHLTNKPLIYSTTNFEGFLSDVCVPGSIRNDITLFPGDADLVLYDAETLDSLALIEFKKHTNSGVGAIEYQSFRKYYHKDQKKYDSLSKLSGRLGLDYFYNVIYSTRFNELNKIKVEKISSSFQLLNDKVFTFNSIQDLEKILININNLI